jgi:hypothetical protein
VNALSSTRRRSTTLPPLCLSKAQNMKIGSIVRSLFAILLAASLLGANAQDGTWKETVIVPTNNTKSILTSSNDPVNQEAN